MHGAAMQSRTRQAGFSLIELMIASVIGLILLAGVVLIAMNASRTQRTLEQVGEQLENGRYATSLLEGEIAHAGYYGDFHGTPPGGGSVPDACSTTVSDIDDALWLPIQGYDSPTGNPAPSCIADTDHVDGTDVLVIRRASTRTTPIDELVAGELYFQSRPNDHVLAVATGAETASSPDQFVLRNRDDTAPAEIRKFRVDLFYLSPDADDVPILTRQSLQAAGGSPGWVTEPLVAGIEQLQIDYGMDRDGDASPEETNPGTSGDAFVTAPGTGNEDDVVAIRVHVIARGMDPGQAYTDDKTYDLGAMGSWTPTDDSFRRRAFVTTIRAVNPGIRRE